MFIHKGFEIDKIFYYGMFFVVLFSAIKEVINIPLIEINQLFLIITFFIYVSSQWLIGAKAFYIRVTPIAVLSVLLIGYMFFQGLFLSINYIDCVRMLKNYLLALLFLIIITSIDYEDYRMIVKNSLNCMTAIFLLEFFLYLFFRPLYYEMFYAPYQNIRHQAGFLSPNSYAVILAFLITYHVYIFLIEKKFINFLFGISLIFPLVSTYSKSGFLITFSGIVLCMWFSQKRFLRLLVVMVIVIGGVMVLSGKIVDILEYFPDSYFAKRFLVYFEEGSIGGERTEGYKQLFDIFQQNFLFGVGFGNITGQNDFFQSFSSPHNEYLRFLVEGGIIGGALFGGIVLISVKKILEISVYSKRRENKIYAIWGILFLLSEIFYNYLNAPREGILLIFMGFSMFTIKEQNLFSIIIEKGDQL